MSSALNGPDTVTGASGHLGRQVIESIVAITRAPGKRLAVQCRGRRGQGGIYGTRRMCTGCCRRFSGRGHRRRCGTDRSGTAIGPQLSAGQQPRPCRLASTRFTETLSC